MPQRKILVLFAHPALQKSRINRVLIRAVRDMPGVTFHDLYEAFPDFDIDVAREQELLGAHDVMVFQHPFFWYSSPAILKEWQDLVLQHGWAYGHEGRALHGKIFLSAVTTGGNEEAYSEGGFNRYAVRDLLTPFAQTATLCGMDPLPPFVVHGTLRMTPQSAEVHADQYRRVLEALRDDRLDLDTVRDWPRLNLDLERAIIGSARG